MYCTKPYLWLCKKNQQAVFSTPAHCCNVLNITWLLKNKWKDIWLNHMRANRKWCITCSEAVLGPKTAVGATELYRPGMKPQWRRFSSWWVGGWRCVPGDGTAGHLGPPQCNWVESQVGSHQESRPAGWTENEPGQWWDGPNTLMHNTDKVSSNPKIHKVSLSMSQSSNSNHSPDRNKQEISMYNLQVSNKAKQVTCYQLHLTTDSRLTQRFPSPCPAWVSVHFPKQKWLCWW